MAPRVLVGLQFFAIGVLLLPLGAAGWVWTGFAVALAGLMGVAWTVGYNRWGNFNIRPEPRPGGALVTTGPYRWVRHPMYLGSLVIGAGACIAGPEPWRIAAWPLLAAVLVAKARREERGLLGQFPGYAEYRRGRAFLIPGIW
ncbi:MAG: hypothetical protein RLZZ188_1186 [Verrucomicrobiota bacterium]|jgi:protein-S-isoprenylcysteine O-methyltransferase Ste14